MALLLDSRPRRVVAIALVALILLSLVPVIPGVYRGNGIGEWLPGGDAFAQECVTTCESFDKLIDSWSIVQSRHDAVVAAAVETGVPVNLIKAIMKLESNGLNLLPNGASAVGPMQVTINNWGWWAQTNGLNLYNAEQNILAGAKILDRFRLQYIEWSREHGIDPWLTALYAYYAGNPYNLLARDSPAQGGSGITTQEYGARIWFSYQFLQENWAALAQSKLQDSTAMYANAGANPARVTDGDIATTWAVSSQGGPPPGAYLQFDLGEPTRVFEIAWVFRTTGHADRLRIRISEDGVNYETVHFAGNAPARAWQYLMLDRSARYVRFNFDNPNGDLVLGYLAEVTIRGVKAAEYVEPPMPAVSLDLPASGGSKGATHTSRIRDGKSNTSWYTNGDAYPASGFVYVDLGYETHVTQVSWLFSKTGGAPLLDIQISNDKRTWTTIGSAGNAPAGEWQRLTVNATGRYVRWLVTNTSGARQLGYIAEVEIRQGGNGEEVSPTPTPDEEEPTHALAGSGGSAGATWTGRIRDGRMDTDWRTSGAPQPASGYVYIDLGSELAIGAIEWVFNQTGGAPALELQVSNDKRVWTTVGAAGDAPANQWQRMNVSVTARYVRWLIVNTSGVEQVGYIAEVRVLAAVIEPTPEPTGTPIPTVEPTSTPPSVDSSQLPGGIPLVIASIADAHQANAAPVLDGSPETIWSSPSGPVWLQADLGSNHQIDHIAWLPADAGCAAGLTLSISDDGDAWAMSVGYPTATAWSWTVASPVITGRYIRWTIDGSGANAGCLAEIAVYGVAVNEETPVSVSSETTPEAIEPTATVEPTSEPELSLPVVPTEPAATEPVEAPTSEPTPEPTIEPTVVPAQEPPAEPTVEPTPVIEPTTPPIADPPVDENGGG